jgi:hypothetical protein
MPIKNSVYDYETNQDKFYGIYRGVVECRYDPERLCRCRIRVWGVHDELKDKTDKRGIPTKELPWAEPAYGLYMGSVSGNGVWTVPLQGSYVWVFFENGNWMRPRYFATIPAMPIEPANPAEGFNDPMGEFPRGDWVEEPDTHRLMKRDKLAETTLLEVKLPKQDMGVDIAFGGAWDEYPPMYQAEYPFNTVMYSHSGIYTEIDDTEENRRYHIYHPSNSYIEIGEIGQMTIRNAEKRWDICDDMKFEHVMNDYHRKVDTNRTSLVLLDQWDEVMLNRYTKIHINDRKDVYNDMIYHIFNDETIYTDSDRSLYVGISSEDWVNINRDMFTGLEYQRITALEEKTLVGYERVDMTFFEHIDWAGIKQDIRCEDVIHIQAGKEIILDAPKVRIKATNFLDHAAKTEIAGEFIWNGIAESCARYAVTAGLAVEGEPDPVEASVAAEAPVPPIMPIPPIILPPSVPPEPPVPPAPPAPPVLDYSDVPPEPDPCPPTDCPEKESIIV